MTALRNEVDPSDPTDHSADAPMGLTIVVLSALHVLCCGLPLLLLSGVSLTALLPNSPMIGGILALVGVAGLSGVARSVARPVRDALSDAGLEISHRGESVRKMPSSSWEGAPCPRGN